MTVQSEKIARLPFARKSGQAYVCHTSGKTVRVLENGKEVFDTGCTPEGTSSYSLSGRDIVRRWDPDWLDDLLDDDAELKADLDVWTTKIERVAKPLRLKVTRTLIDGYSDSMPIVWDLTASKPVSVATVRNRMKRLDVVVLGEDYPKTRKLRVLVQSEGMLEACDFVSALFDAFKLTPARVRKSLSALNSAAAITNVWATFEALTVWLDEVPPGVDAWANKLVRQLRPTSLERADFATMLKQRRLELVWP